MKQSAHHKRIDIYFKKWTRKKYGIFSSLNKSIKICTLLATYTILNRQGPATAQTDTIYLPQKIEVEEVEIIGQRAPGVYSNSARVVTVIASNEINAAPVSTLNDLLEYFPGIDIRQRGILGVQADIGIRGGSFDQTLLLINGIPFNDPQTGHHNLNLPFPYHTIEKIEILEGPGSRIYGANAFSGVVNIITKSGNNENLNLSFTAGQHNYYSTGISAGYKTGNLTSFISLSGKGTQGYTDNTDFIDFSGYYSGRYLTSFGNFELQAGYTNKAFGANSFYTARYPEQYEQVKSKFFTLKYISDKIVKTKFYFAWRRHHDRFELFREDRYRYHDGFFIDGSDTAVYSPGVYENYNYYPGHNYHLTNVVTGGMNVSIPSELGISSVGIEFKNDRILSNVLGLPLNISLDVPGEDRGRFSMKDQRSIISLFAEHTFSLKSYFFSGGLLCLYNEMNGINTFLGGEISKKTGKYSRLFFSANQSLRLPTFTDLYYNGPSNTGNRQLQPERALTIEGGYKVNISAINIQVSAFSRSGKDIIDWVKLPEETKYTTMNFTRLNTRGFGVNAGYNPQYKVNSTSWINYLNVSYNYLYTDKNSRDYISAYALDYLKHKLTARFSHKIFRSLSMGWNLTWQDRNGTYTDKNLVEHNYQPFFIVNSKIYWKQKKSEVFLEAANLFNVAYRDFGSIVQPGRWIFAGIIIDLNLRNPK